jgi:hypothetical protein
MDIDGEHRSGLKQRDHEACSIFMHIDPAAEADLSNCCQFSDIEFVVPTYA